MTTNIEKYKTDLKKLVSRADLLFLAIQYESYPDQFTEQAGDMADKIIEKLPSFKEEYQSWYSEATALIRQLLPDRLDDFRRHYEKPKSRKDISFENYRIEDCLQGLVIRTGFGEKKCGPESAIPHLRQQIAILKSVESRFHSSLFDIRQLVQADLFDSELAAATELSKKGFHRGAGAVAGVVLEKHLGQVFANHALKTRKKNPTISDFNDGLKNGGVIDTPEWRNIQRLGDIRNLCDHSKDRDPTDDEVEELIHGVGKMTKTLF
ncbi:hypothetical protein RBH88_03165 [Aminobacterium sp. MB27-C1]|uniref:hypothetical protein n=1 Tax=Aminobacterium sp. MB27-C1 TaxID=3070661 RepID=UPI0027DBF601|nr:hypothetical protein [Aminobacterium sp. MB27-C1]WMI72113.1 hypothetical protein RBH88_03165 [Aminobacterium sp. MB27-C1]